MTADEQEALSKRYGNEIIILLPLSSGNVAVFNSARELCGIIKHIDHRWIPSSIPFPPECWFPPKTKEVNIKVTPAAADLLKDLGLL